VPTAEPEILTPASRRWVERVQRPLDLLAVIFLVDVILIWSLPDGPPAFLQTLNVIAWIVWACFAVDYVAAAVVRGEGQVRTDTVAAWFVRRHSEPSAEPADAASRKVEPSNATTADTQALFLDRLDELAASQGEIRAMLIELQRPPTSSQ
jgi:hypothetical protein